MVYHAPYPRIRSWKEGSGGDGSAELDVLRSSILGRLIAPADVAAIVIEPIQGEGGYFPAPASFLRGLRELCDEHGILLVADEVQSGMGRTGRWWAIQHAGVEPDIVTTAKGIASGMPLGAFVARDSVMTWPAGAHGSTFAGNPICAAAGKATMDLIEGGLMENAARMGARLRSGHRAGRRRARRRPRHPRRGPDAGDRVRQPRRPPTRSSWRASSAACCVLECGEATIRLCPPLIVDEEAVDTAIRLFAEAIAAAATPVKGMERDRLG